MESGRGEKRKLTTARAEELEVDLTAAEGRQPTRVKTRVVKAETRQSYPDRPWPPEWHVHRLSGRTVVSQLGKGGWTSALEKGEADDNMKFTLSLFRPWSPEDGLFPARTVSVGATWDIDPKALTSFPCAFVSPRPDSFTLKGKGKFRAVEKHQGQPCAVVEYNLTLKGKEKGGRAWAATLKLTVYRSLRDGVNLKTVCDSDLRAADAEPGFKMSGKQKLETVVTVK
jgi:hypothetical protein